MSRQANQAQQRALRIGHQRRAVAEPRDHEQQDRRDWSSAASGQRPVAIRQHDQGARRQRADDRDFFAGKREQQAGEQRC